MCVCVCAYVYVCVCVCMCVCVCVWITKAHEILHFNNLTGQLTEIMKPMQDKGKLSTSRLQIRFLNLNPKP